LAGNVTHFYEEEEIWILTLGGRPRTLLDVVVGDVDTLGRIEYQASNSRRRPTILLSYP